MNNHTQGPWYTTGSDSVGLVFGGPSHALIVPHMPEGFTSEEQMANAHLIAAAPDLLREIKLLIKLIQSRPQSEIDFQDVECAVEAIVKAEGNQS